MTTKNGLEFAPAELQLLIACRFIQVRRRKEPNRAAIAELLPRLFEDEAVDTAPAEESLRFRGLLTMDAEGGIALSAEGLDLAEELFTAREQAGFGEWMTKSERSPAYLEFCRRVYGTSFVQFGMLDQEQLEALIASLALSPRDRVLDLGCGIGVQAEYIADRTGARVTGLDFAEAAIVRARERTGSKTESLEFVLGDLNALDVPPRSYEAALAIDTLYFVDDLEKTLADIVRLLVPGGRLAAFYSLDKKDEDRPSVLEAENTPLGLALKKLGLSFDTIDFTENDRRLWEKQLAVATDLKGAFEAEGNAELWKSRDAEARQVLPFFEKKAWRRYLYLARI